MAYKNFRIHCIIRVLLLGASIYLFFYLLLQTTLYATIVIVGSIIVYQIYSLIHYVEKTNRDLTRFLEAIKHTDFSQTFTSTGLGSSFEPLKKAFNEVIEQFRRARSEKEEHFRYLQTVVQHVGIGLLAFGHDGEVILINTAAKRLLRVTHLKNITALETLSKPLVAALLQFETGGKALIKVEEKNDLLQLAIYATEFKLREQIFTLVSLQNIQSELEEKEMEAWQNLVRVLTHEIMNSVTPISSLAGTVEEELKPHIDQENGQTLNRDQLNDIHLSLQTISKRSEGLIQFVKEFRSLTNIPKPRPSMIPVKSLLDELTLLHRKEVTEKNINLSISVYPEDLTLMADKNMIEQVIINLLKNAIQAFEDTENKTIELKASLNDKSRPQISIKDNGTGIEPEALEKIFIPFFTTKKSGSGIGLSLSRQIMRQHQGTLTVKSTVGKGTEFLMRF